MKQKTKARKEKVSSSKVSSSAAIAIKRTDNSIVLQDKYKLTAKTIKNIITSVEDDMCIKKTPLLRIIKERLRTEDKLEEFGIKKISISGFQMLHQIMNKELENVFYLANVICAINGKRTLDTNHLEMAFKFHKNEIGINKNNQNDFNFNKIFKKFNSAYKSRRLESVEDDEVINVDNLYEILTQELEKSTQKEIKEKYNSPKFRRNIVKKLKESENQ
ncbi:hypothetical protein ABK040_000014 [Willaertia magna]